jgi:hypothetical protein
LRQIFIVLTLLLPAGPGNAQQLLLYGGTGHDEFLGCLNCNKNDSASVCNKYGKGSKYDGNSIFNKYGTFGSKYSSSSPWNKYSSDNSVPVIFDPDGNFYGYFTINKYRSDAVNYASDLEKLFKNVDGDLEIVRDVLCESF